MSFSHLLPEDLQEKMTDDVSYKFIIRDPLHKNGLWKEKLKLHFPWVYETLDSTAKTIDWKKLFWKTYNEDIEHIRTQLIEYNSNACYGSKYPLKLLDLKSDKGDQLSKTIKKMFSCVIEGHDGTFKKMLTLLLQYENPLQLLNITNKNGETLLDCICATGKNILFDEIYKKIVIKKPYVEIYNKYCTCTIDNDQRSFFSWAMICRQSAIRDAMLREKKGIDLRELFVAAKFNDSETMSILIPYLIGNSIDIHKKDPFGKTPLHYAASKGHVQVIPLLLNHKADINAVDNDNKTSLHHAAGRGHTQVIPLLLNHKADINAVDNDNRTPLHHAAGRGHTQVIPLLLNHKADVNAVDNNNRTPLHYAASRGHTQVIQLLLNSKAAVNAVDNNNRTPLHYAKRDKHVEAIQLLENPTSNQKLTSFHHASHDNFSVSEINEQVAMSADEKIKEIKQKLIESKPFQDLIAYMARSTNKWRQINAYLVQIKSATSREALIAAVKDNPKDVMFDGKTWKHPYSMRANTACGCFNLFYRGSSTTKQYALELEDLMTRLFAKIEPRLMVHTHNQISLR